MKLQQGQVWKTGDEFVRIVELHRLEVKYKAIKDLQTREGEHHHVTKKQFCRLIKNATLLDSAAVQQLQAFPGEAPSEASIPAEQRHD
jgi:hypothetical protein